MLCPWSRDGNAIAVSHGSVCVDAAAGSDARRRAQLLRRDEASGRYIIMAGSTGVLPTMLTIGGANLRGLVEDEELLQGMHFSGLVGEKVRIPGSPIMRAARS